MPRGMIDIRQESVGAIPKDKTPASVSERGFGNVIPAVNSGAVEIKCIINRKCPFKKGDAVHQELVFNSQSVKNFPSDTKAVLGGVDGSEGMFLAPSIKFRHTFIAAAASTTSGSQTELDKLDPPKGAFVSSLPSYERFQRFIISPTVFDTDILRPSEYVTTARVPVTSTTASGTSSTPSQTSGTGCKDPVRWQYEIINKGDRFDPGSDNIRVGTLMPKQIASTTCNPFGNHWRVVKQTPIFHGQDFFVEFHRRAVSIDIPEKARDAANTFYSDPFKIAQYLPLDTNYVQPQQGATGVAANILKSNRGVVRYDSSGNAIDKNTYNIRDQAYYIVEIGMNTDHHYIFLFTQRGNPLCLRLSNGASILVSEYKNELNAESNQEADYNGVTGRQLMEGDWTRMTFRNHLGHLHVQFEGKGYKSKVWDIARVDTQYDNAGQAVSETPVRMIVEEAPMAIWGGNLCCGFLFGVLQYASGGMDNTTGISRPVVIRIPPLTQEKEALRATSNQQGGNNNPGNPTAPSNQTLSLPLGVKHKYTPTMTDEVVAGNPNRYFFCQDAQLFSWFDGAPPRTGDGAANIQNVPGTFFSENRPYKAVTRGKESKIEMRGVNYSMDRSDNVAFFRLEVKMTPGGHTFEDTTPQFVDSSPARWIVPACKTPVLTSARILSQPDNSDRWTTRAVDVSEHVLEYSDCWSAQDFFKIDHTGCIKFYVNPGVRYANNQTDFLLSLLNKAFYIEVWARYANLGDGNCNYSQLNQYYKLFTGVCYGGTLNVDKGTRVMDCQISDYSKILQDSTMFNSPFYDGVRDVNVVKDILNQAGFKSLAGDDPGRLVSLFAEYNDQTMHFGLGPDGRIVPVQIYALPSAPAILSQPFYKFSNGDRLYDAILKVGQRGGKCFFFDSYGVAHFESYFDFAVVGAMQGAQDPSTLALWWYTTNPNFSPGQMIFNGARIQRAVGDVFNHVKMYSSTPNNTPFWADDEDPASLTDPTLEGFIGYRKTVFQQDGIFGSPESVRQVMFFYQSMRRPPLIVNFESYGLPIRALDLCVVDGQVTRIMKVDTQIIPKENKWWNSVEAEWLYAPRLASEQNGPRNGNPPVP